MTVDGYGLKGWRLNECVSNWHTEDTCCVFISSGEKWRQAENNNFIFDTCERKEKFQRTWINVDIMMKAQWMRGTSTYARRLLCICLQWLITASLRDETCGHSVHRKTWSTIFFLAFFILYLFFSNLKIMIFTSTGKRQCSKHSNTPNQWKFDSYIYEKGSRIVNIPGEGYSLFGIYAPLSKS